MDPAQQQEPVLGVVHKPHPDCLEIQLVHFERDRNRLSHLFLSKPARYKAAGVLFGNSFVENLPQSGKSAFEQLVVGDKLELLELKQPVTKNQRWHVVRARYLEENNDVKFVNCLGVVYRPADKSIRYAIIRSAQTPPSRDTRIDLKRFNTSPVNTGDVVMFDAVYDNMRQTVTGTQARALSHAEIQEMHLTAAPTNRGVSPMYQLWHCLLYSEAREQCQQTGGEMDCTVAFGDLTALPIQGQATLRSVSVEGEIIQPAANLRLKKGDSVILSTFSDQQKGHLHLVSKLSAVITSLRHEDDTIIVYFDCLQRPPSMGHFLARRAYDPAYFRTLAVTDDNSNLDTLLYPIKQGGILRGGAVKQSIISALRGAGGGQLPPPLAVPDDTTFSLRIGGQDIVANAEQSAIIYNIARSSQPLVTVSGPPGTSKSVTIVMSVYEYLRENPNGRVLICAPSNTAVDRLGDLLVQLPVNNVVRPLRILTSNKELQGYSTCPDITLHNRVTEAFDGRFGADDGTIRTAVETFNHSAATVNELQQQLLIEGLSQDERNKLDVEYRARLIDRIRDRGRVEHAVQMAINPNVVLVTCASCSDSRVLANTDETNGFTSAFVDEAGQATDVEALLVAHQLSDNSCNSMILVGDVKQLPPTTLTGGVAAEWIGLSMFEKLLDDNFSSHYELLQSYRCHPGLLTFINEQTYGGRLTSAVTGEQRSLDGLGLNTPFTNPDVPIVFVEVKGATRVTPFSSKFNELEADCIARVCANMGGKNVPLKGVINILTPYEAQRLCISRRLRTEGISTADNQITTVDGFQGRETEISILSLVRSGYNPDEAEATPTDNLQLLQKRHLGFVCDERRAVVALSRARRGLIVVGDPDTLRLSAYWSNFLNYYSSLPNGFHIYPPDPSRE